MTIDIESDHNSVWLIGDPYNPLTIKGYVDFIAIMVKKLDEVNPTRVYRREWEV